MDLRAGNREVDTSIIYYVHCNPPNWKVETREGKSGGKFENDQSMLCAFIKYVKMKPINPYNHKKELKQRQILNNGLKLKVMRIIGVAVH